MSRRWETLEEWIRKVNDLLVEHEKAKKTVADFLAEVPR